MAEIPILMFIGKAAATAVIGNRVNWVISKIEGFLSSEGLETTKRNLERILPHIQAVILAVDRGMIKDQNEGLDKWLWQLRDAVEEAESAIDELDYYKLEEKVKSQYSGIYVGCTVPNSATVSIKKQIQKLAKHIPKPDDATLKRFKNAVEGLDTVASGVGAFLQLINGIIKSHNDSSNSKDQQQTGAMLIDKVFGRAEEKNIILKWISDSGGGSEIESNVSAFSIVGMGGIGKTTLARLIYKEVETKKIGNFSKVMWVSVSDIFETLNSMAVTRMILEDITKKSWNNVENLNTLQKNLQKHVASKKFFLVLDDIWRDDPNSETQLKQIIAPLKSGAKGSKILFTTRMGLVADMIAKVMEEPRRKKNHLVLGGLEEREFVKLFNKNVFGTVDPDVNKNFQTVAMKIARKVGGSPLGAKVMDRLLNNRTDNIQYWNRIAEQDISEIQGDKNGILAALKLNYHHLSGNVQQCLRFCSLFPQDHRFKQDELVQMWIGSGLIQLENKQHRLEDTGADYFDILIRKSFFHLSEDSDNCYVMHDLMHEMAVMVSTGECLRTDDVCESIPKTIRHLSIKIKSFVGIKEISHFEHLQSLFIEFTGEKTPPKGELNKFEKYLGKMKSLRLLSLIGHNLFKVPKTVGNLKHLRYISLHQTGKKKELDWFPSSVYKLYHLQVMIFAASDVRDLMKVKMGGMNNLINLRSLNVHSSVMRNIPRINTLTSLQKLESFNITDGRKTFELKDLKEVRGVAIHGLENVKSPQEAKEAKLNEKGNLRVLSLNWSQTKCSNSKEILGNLQPHNSIQTIRISGYNADNFPVWMTNFSFRNLSSLELKDCCELKTLPPLGNLPSLKYLILSYFPVLEEISNSFYGRQKIAFQALKELRIQKMDKLKDWVEIQGRTTFPRLEVLTLEGCPLLIKLPKLPPTLLQLDVHNSGLNMIPRGVESLKTLSLNQCPTLLSNHWDNFFPSSIEELKIEGSGDNISLESSLRNLGMLARLDLINCPDIKSLPPAEVLVKLVSLSNLHISNCKDLSSLGGLKAVISLKYLKLTGCTKLITMSRLKIPTMVDSKKIKPESPTLYLEELFIDSCSLLSIEPIKSLCCTKKLNISEKFEERFLPKEWLIQNRVSLKEVVINDASVLKTVPPSFTEFDSMEKLILYQASQIKSLADLPCSLIDLVVTGCNEAVKEVYMKEFGSNWYEIAHIPFPVIS